MRTSGIINHSHLGGVSGRVGESDFLPPSKKINNLFYLPAARKMKKLPKKYGLGSSSPPDIIFISANHTINTSSLTPVHLPYSRNLPILLQFCVFGDLTPSGAAMLQRFLEPCSQHCNPQLMEEEEDEDDEDDDA